MGPERPSSAQCALPWGRTRKDSSPRILRHPKTALQSVYRLCPFIPEGGEPPSARQPLPLPGLHTPLPAPTSSRRERSSVRMATENRVTCHGASDSVTLKSLSNIQRAFF